MLIGNDYYFDLLQPRKLDLGGYLSLFHSKLGWILGGRIKTHDSESRGQEEAGRTRRRSELFTRSTALKFVNALNKPP